jgi:hypothetical protein
MKKLLLALVAGIVIALAIPNSRVAPPVWRDDYIHEPGWAGPVIPKPIRGRATWYDATKNNAWYTQPNKWGKAVRLYAAAGPALRRALGGIKWQMKPRAIWVESVQTGVRVKVWVVDWCGCYGSKKDALDTRLVDLAPAVWDALGVPLGQGVMKVRITLQKGELTR